MTENVYAPPQTRLLNPADDVEQASMFYVVSKKKFLILFFSTLGFYAIYWSYKNWKEYKNSTGAKVTPALRGIFLIFFMHSLFRHVDETLEGKRLSFAWSHQASATWLVILICVSNVLDRTSMREIGSPYTDLASVAIMLPMAFAYLKPQLAINAACGDPEGVSNDKLTGANYIFVAIGTLLWCLALLGLASYF